MKLPVLPFVPADLSIRQLLAASVAVIDELLRRGLVRTRNAPLGDLAETIALRAYGGVLAPNSEKSYDLLTDDGRRIQVKARLVDPADRRSQQFSAFRSWDFDVAVFVLLDARTYDIIWARELTSIDAQQLGRRVEHTNSSAVLVRQVAAAGRDVSQAMIEAFESLDEPG
ncbi:hypothetical protein [Curtobacterium sp. 458]|uniref:DUF6998 domain-containing protein n=1 Tax=Curtobacterium sp. 458 TaxID=3050069 RepID=UPI0025B56FB9|nr:hypothetical protein [Curtobacterium sp. 458]WJX99865.1 hypothetical protein QPJ90_16420 [Curtobacterium sp. 458]